MAELDAVPDGVAVPLGDAEARGVAELEAEPEADGEADGDEAEAEVSAVPESEDSVSAVQPEAASSRAAAVRAIRGFFMFVRIWWGVRIWSPV